MLWRQLTAVRISGEGVQFLSCLGFENVDAHCSSFSGSAGWKSKEKSAAADRKAVTIGRAAPGRPSPTRSKHGKNLGTPQGLRETIGVETRPAVLACAAQTDFAINLIW